MCQEMYWFLLDYPIYWHVIIHNSFCSVVFPLHHLCCFSFYFFESFFSFFLIIDAQFNWFCVYLQSPTHHLLIFPVVFLIPIHLFYAVILLLLSFYHFGLSCFLLSKNSESQNKFGIFLLFWFRHLTCPRITASTYPVGLGLSCFCFCLISRNFKNFHFSSLIYWICVHDI